MEKIVVRWLPPALDEGPFWKSLHIPGEADTSPESKIVAKRYIHGRLAAKKNDKPSTAYIVFRNDKDAAAFKESFPFDKYSAAVVEPAPYQRFEPFPLKDKKTGVSTSSAQTSAGPLHEQPLFQEFLAGLEANDDDAPVATKQMDIDLLAQETPLLKHLREKTVSSKKSKKKGKGAKGTASEPGTQKLSQAALEQLGQDPKEKKKKKKRQRGGRRRSVASKGSKSDVESRPASRVSSNRAPSVTGILTRDGSIQGKYESGVAPETPSDPGKEKASNVQGSEQNDKQSQPKKGKGRTAKAKKNTKGNAQGKQKSVAGNAQAEQRDVSNIGPSQESGQSVNTTPMKQSDTAGAGLPPKPETRFNKNKASQGKKKPRPQHIAKARNENTDANSNHGSVTL